MTYYNTIASGYDELYEEEQKKKLKLILKHIKIKSVDKILDVGCGTASYWDLIPSKNITGIDSAKDLIKQSKHKNKIIVGKAENLPFEDNSFDIVISLTAIHNFEDYKKGLKEIKRVGKNRFVFSILKKSRKFKSIKEEIYKLFKVKQEIDEGKDIIFIIG